MSSKSHKGCNTERMNIFPELPTYCPRCAKPWGGVLRTWRFPDENTILQLKRPKPINMPQPPSIRLTSLFSIRHSSFVIPPTFPPPPMTAKITVYRHGTHE